jgi:outer membrane receptor protein involved in Fe transport
VLWTNSVFQLEEDNIAATDPDNVGNEDFQILIGEARVRGFESELVGTVTPNFELGAGIALLDSEITESADGFEGNRFPNTPRVQLSALASYRWAAFRLPWLRTHLGVVRVGGREANSANEYRLPAYTRVYVGADVALGAGFEATLRVENLLDETYYTAAQDSGSGSDQVGVGDRRLVQVGLRWVF